MQVVVDFRSRASYFSWQSESTTGFRLKESDVNKQLYPGGYLRVHLHPKRFPPVYKVDWKSRVLYVNQHMVVVHKPRGVPSIPTRDNEVENVMTQV